MQFKSGATSIRPEANFVENYKSRAEVYSRFGRLYQQP